MPCERKHIVAIMKALTDKGLMIMSIDATADAFKEALAACDHGAWRGMDSAPKDGTHIACEWCESRRIEQNCVYDSTTGEWGYRGGLMGIVLYDPQPDCWHPEFPPLPAAPGKEVEASHD